MNKKTIGDTSPLNLSLPLVFKNTFMYLYGWADFLVYFKTTIMTCCILITSTWQDISQKGYLHGNLVDEIKSTVIPWIYRTWSYRYIYKWDLGGWNTSRNRLLSWEMGNTTLALITVLYTPWAKDQANWSQPLGQVSRCQGTHTLLGVEAPLQTDRQMRLDVSLGTFGIFVQINFDIRCWDITLLLFAPADPRPSISFILLNDVQYFTFCNRYGSFIFTWWVKKQSQDCTMTRE